MTTKSDNAAQYKDASNLRKRMSLFQFATSDGSDFWARVLGHYDIRSKRRILEVECGDGLPSERLHDERKGEQRQQREDRDHGRHYTTAYPRGIYVLDVGHTKGRALADPSSLPGVGYRALCSIVSGISPSNIHDTFVIIRKALMAESADKGINI